MEEAEDRDVGVGGFPEGEEVVVGGAGFFGFAYEGQGAGQLSMRERANPAIHDDAFLVDDLSEFGGGGVAIAGLQVGEDSTRLSQ